MVKLAIKAGKIIGGGIASALGWAAGEKVVGK